MSTAPNDPQHGDDAAMAALLRRVASSAAVHMYEMEMVDELEYVCHVWIGQAVETLLGGVPDGMTSEEAWEACIHPDDRAAYDAAFPALFEGKSTETEYRLVGFDGATRWVWERCVPRPARDGRLLVDGIVNDITDRHLVEEQLAAAHERLSHMAFHDHLTGLPNRAQFEQHLQVALGRAGRDGTAVAVFFVDLDGFKPINDAHGHGVGDALLRAVADRLRTATRDGDVVARLGGDEFLMLAPIGSPDDTVTTDAVCARVSDLLADAFVVDGHRLAVGGSIGLAVYPRDAETPDELIRQADLAMYRTKHNRRAA
jgi:diguanylate cyclase (GGDEF)-like protein/PAS domain S-box-containing protein